MSVSLELQTIVAGFVISGVCLGLYSLLKIEWLLHDIKDELRKRPR